MPKYPNVSVRLIGEDGNAFAILGTVMAAFKKGKVPVAEVEKFIDEATSGDYDHLLGTVMTWVNVE